MSEPHCPHCGAENAQNKYSFTSYTCGYIPARTYEGCSLVSRRSNTCYEREIAQKDAEIAALKAKLEGRSPVCPCGQSTGWTSVRCCNTCGDPLPDENWHSNKMAALKEENAEKTESAIRIVEWGNKMEKQRNALLKQVSYFRNKLNMKNANGDEIENPESLPRPDQPGYWWKIDGGKLQIGKAEIIQWEVDDGESIAHVLAWSCGGVWTRCDSINRPNDTGSRWVKAVEPFVSIHIHGAL